MHFHAVWSRQDTYINTVALFPSCPSACFELPSSSHRLTYSMDYADSCPRQSSTAVQNLPSPSSTIAQAGSTELSNLVSLAGLTLYADALVAFQTEKAQAALDKFEEIIFGDSHATQWWGIPHLSYVRTTIAVFDLRSIRPMIYKILQAAHIVSFFQLTTSRLPSGYKYSWLLYLTSIRTITEKVLLFLLVPYLRAQNSDSWPNRLH